MKRQTKPFVVVAGYLRDESGRIVGDWISEFKLLDLYGLTEDEAYIAKENDPISFIATGQAIKLFSRINGDYVEHLEYMLKEYWEKTGQHHVKKAKKKTKFITDVLWYNQLKKRGKG